MIYRGNEYCMGKTWSGQMEGEGLTISDTHEEDGGEEKSCIEENREEE